MAPLAPRPDGKIVLFHTETGQRFERWPVDAREMVATGAYTLEPPEGHVEPTVEPPTLGIKQLPREIAPGVPANYTHARDAKPAGTFIPPSGRTAPNPASRTPKGP